MGDGIAYHPDVIFAATIAAVILLAGLAWGPGFHASCADRILRDARERRRRSEELACIAAYPDEFIYGNIAADLIHIKRYGGATNGCHHWSLEQRIFALVRSDADLSFALGCLTHLAADVVAHNFFVPFHKIHGFPPVTLGHAYWEARADGTIQAPTWRAIADLRRRESLRRLDHVLHDAVPRRALSLTSNRILFHHLTLAASRKRWRPLIEFMRRKPPRGDLVRDHLDGCTGLSLYFMREALDPERRIEIAEWDPLGRQSLRTARTTRRELIVVYGDRSRAADPSRAIARRRFGLS